MLRQNYKKRKTKIIISAFLALFLTIIVFKSFPPKFVSNSVLFFSKPIISIKTSIDNFVENKKFVFKNKDELQKENEYLKEKILEAEVEAEASKIVFKENKELKEMLGRGNKNEFILASIILRPNFGGYNTIIIDAGSEQGVEEGMQVSVFGDALLGRVFEVFSDYSKVKTVAYPEEQTNVFIEGATSAIAIGLGGENMQVELPNDINIKVGNTVNTLGTKSLFLGFVEEIIKEPADPFQKIIFRLPFNIQEIKNVYLIK